MNPPQALLFAPTLFLQAAGGVIAARECLLPEPSTRIRYNELGATPQERKPHEVDFVTRYLRTYQNESVKAGRSPFWTTGFPDAGGSTEVDAEGLEASLVGYGESGGQMGIIIDTRDPLYKSEAFANGGLRLSALSSSLFGIPMYRVEVEGSETLRNLSAGTFSV